MKGTLYKVGDTWRVTSSDEKHDILVDPSNYEGLEEWKDAWRKVTFDIIVEGVGAPKAKLKSKPLFNKKTKK